MKSNRYILLLTVLLLGLVSALQAQTNKLYIPDVSIQKGKTIALPVYMDNANEIVAAQFTLQLPDALALNATSASMDGNRSDGHTVTVRNIGDNKYMFMIVSAANAAIKGRTGKLLSVSLSGTSRMEEGATYGLTMTNAVLSLKSGRNVLTEQSVGKVSVTVRPDLIVKDVACAQSTASPGQTLNVSWMVENIGGMATADGFNESLYLVDAAGNEKYIGKTSYDADISENGILARSADISLSQILGIDGACAVKVVLSPNSSECEPREFTGNNAAVSSAQVSISKQLTITTSHPQLLESSPGNYYFYLNRSGNNSSAETFAIAQTADSRVTVPATVTIPAGSNGERFVVAVANNTALDDNAFLALSASGNGYGQVTKTIALVDDELPSLTLTPAAGEVTEGGRLEFSLTVNRAPSAALPVKLSTNFPRRFSLPENVVIPAGTTSTTFTIEATENDEADIEQVVTLYASADDHNTAEKYFVLIDNDMPSLELDITPSAVSEAAGPLSLTAKLRRVDKLDKVVTVKLADDSDGGIYYGTQTIRLDKGVETATIQLGPIDNLQVDGERVYNISAAVYIASCSCNASLGSKEGIVSVPITIYDNDGPTLTLSSPVSVLKEGTETSVTVTRNTDTTAPLTVSVSCKEEGIEYPSQVTIPAGSASATFTVKSTANDITGDGFVATITASADQFAKANVFFTVSDVTLPDAQVSDISVAQTEVVVGGMTEVTVTITNTGAYTLPEQTRTNLYINGQSDAVGAYYLQTDLAPGESASATKAIEMPTRIGRFDLYAVVNADNKVSELSHANNTSKTISVSTISPFTVSVSTDKAVYTQGEAVTVTGSLSGTVAEQEVEVYLINEGYRNVLKATTDAKGKFSVVFQPNLSQMGHFVVGACYPDERLTDELAAFDIYGIRRADASYIKMYPTVGETYHGTFAVTNPGLLAVSGVKASVISKPENCEVTIDCPESIAAGETVVVSYALTSAEQSVGDSWEKAAVSITAEEGASFETTLYYYAKYAEGYLKSSVYSINATMQKGKTREYPITIKNEGAGETGKITLALPSWMKSATPTEMASLAPGESADIVLLFTPDDQMQINLPVTGTLGINCERGNGVAVTYSVEPVSEEKGTLLVDVCDEYTYYTAEAPHVSNAVVKVMHPYTGAEIISGETDEDGHFTTVLPEGYYRIMITADKHETYNNYVSINAGRTENVTVNVSYQPITVTWNVEETEVEDEYRIITNVKYETNVPAPVVKVTLPERIDGDNMAVGDVTMINMTLTNVGLIRAENVDLLYPKDSEEWKFEPLAYTDLFSLAPQQSVTVPVRITRISDPSVKDARGMRKSPAGTLVSTYGDCMANMGARYKYLCGTDLKDNQAAEALAMKFCTYAATMAAIFDAIGGGGGGGGIGGPGGNGGGSVGASGHYNGVTKTLDICDPCDAKRIKKIVETGLKYTWLGTYDSAVTDAIDQFQKGNDPGLGHYVKITAVNLIDQIKSGFLDFITGGFGKLFEITYDIYEVVDVCNEKEGSSVKAFTNAQRKSKSQQDEAFDETAMSFVEYVKTLDTLLLSAFGDRVWYNDFDEGKLGFISYVQGLPDGTIPSDEDIRANKPESVSFEQAKEYVLYFNGLSSKEPAIEELNAAIGSYSQQNNAAREAGYASMFDQFDQSYTSYEKHLQEKAGSSVCATITLQFSQTMTMTRQAFRGTLTVFNGHEYNAMKDVRLNLVVKNDATGEIATSHEFQVNPETLRGFSGQLDLASGWTLEANETGVATIVFIPTKYAAPSESQLYSFGGSLVYTDPYTGLEVTRDLYPITMTVKPSPILDLTYFMQRDVLGDDPLTADIEPSEEAEFSLLINNKGYGDATNVRMVTEQPRIIDNQKGLYVDFELISSQLNGGDKTLALGGNVATDFGTIPAMSSSYAQWWFKSSLLGHFVDYDVSATHVTSYGNEDLTLLDEVTIHELIRSLKSGDEMAFLVNDIQDDKDTPDMLYLASGDILPVSALTSAALTRVSDTEYTLTVIPSLEGWFYGNLIDPTRGRAKIASVVRNSDGKELHLRNFWQTSATLRDGKEPLYENRLHFAESADATETYTILFELLPEEQLAVEKFEGIPEEGQTSDECLESVTVVFSKVIDPDTFTGEDITFAVQGVKQDASLIAISTDDNKTFRLDLSAFNAANGYYTLTVQTAAITDEEGFSGSAGKTIGWTVYNAELDNLRFVDRMAYTQSEEKVYNTIIYSRQFDDTEWQSLYVPFSIDYEEWKDKVEIAEIVGMHCDNGGDATADDVILEYHLICSGNTQPHTPYLIKAAEVGTVDLTLLRSPITYPAVSATVDLSSAYTQYLVRGTYLGVDGQAMLANKHFAVSGDNLKLAEEASAKLLPQRWYLDVYNYDGYPFSGTEILIREFNATSIETVDIAPSSNGRIYTLDGRLIDTNGTTSKLNRGVYIRDGKKFVVR